ncbi:MAG: hypothetical protein HC876_21830, partial [Chloroflexaceae bacterium]|nr:hypothetical protein [Chloroflexaceae bacterium]
MQARPITHLAAPAQGGRVVWSGTNLQEILPGVPTPATWSTIAYGLGSAMRHLFEQYGYTWSSDEPPVRTIWGRGYLNLSRLSDAAWHLFGVDPQHLTETLGGGHLDALPPYAPATLRDRLRHARNVLRFAIQCSAAVARSERDFAAVVAWSVARRAELREPLDGPRLVALIQRVQRSSARFMQLYLLILLGGIGSYAFLRRIVQRYTNLDAGSINALMMGLGDVPSVTMSRHLIRLATVATSDPDTSAWLERGDWHNWQAQLADSPLAHELAAFLAQYGQRVTSISELELAHPRWREDPASIFETLRNLSHTPPASGMLTAPDIAQRQRSEQALVAALPLLWRGPVWLLLREAQRYTRLREVAKHHLLHIIGVGRDILVRAGHSLTHQEALAHPDDIFYLELDQMIDGLQHITNDLTGQVQQARLRQARYRQFEPADVFVGDVPCYTSQPLHQHGDGLLLRGVASSPGRVTGQARVLRDPAEGSALKPGEILVCPTTDSAWIPLFFRASGLVVEVGGVLSHGAIIARELGIPTVTNVRGATSQVESGQVITVDGGSGTVLLPVEQQEATI